ncbi:MAG: hypothetical protein HYT31_03685 [Parcubacteria group bacterium]|nr:hypothetical protein [Parcubacteria group bacterium]
MGAEQVKLGALFTPAVFVLPHLIHIHTTVGRVCIGRGYPAHEFPYALQVVVAVADRNDNYGTCPRDLFGACAAHEPMLFLPFGEGFDESFYTLWLCKGQFLLRCAVFAGSVFLCITTKTRNCQKNGGE